MRYLVSYSPQGVAPGGWHRLEVRVKHRGATVKARPGYFAGQWLNRLSYSSAHVQSLEGKVAIVTGGSRGIGCAIAAALLQKGAHVAISGVKKDHLEKAEAELTRVAAGGARVLIVCGRRPRSSRRGVARRRDRPPAGRASTFSSTTPASDGSAASNRRGTTTGAA